METLEISIQQVLSALAGASQAELPKSPFDGVSDAFKGSDIVSFISRRFQIDENDTIEVLEELKRQGFLAPVSGSGGSALERHYEFSSGDSVEGESEDISSDSEGSSSSHSSPSEDHSPRSGRPAAAAGGPAKRGTSKKLESFFGTKNLAPAPPNESPSKNSSSTSVPKRKQSKLKLFVKRISSVSASALGSGSTSSSEAPAAAEPAPIATAQQAGSSSKLNKLLGQQVVRNKPESSTSPGGGGGGVGAAGLGSSPGVGGVGIQGDGIGSARSTSKLAKMLGAEIKSDSAPVASSSKEPKPQKANKKRTKTGLELIPVKLDSPQNTLESMEVLPKGYIVAQYKNTGTVAVAEPLEGTILFLRPSSNSSNAKVLGVQFRFPLLLVLRDNMELQVYNVELDRTMTVQVSFEDSAINTPVAAAPASSSSTGRSPPVVPPRPVRKDSTQSPPLPTATPTAIATATAIVSTPPPSAMPPQAPAITVTKAAEKQRGTSILFTDLNSFVIVGTFTGMYKTIKCPLNAFTSDLFQQQHHQQSAALPGAKLKGLTVTSLSIPSTAIGGNFPYALVALPKHCAMHHNRILLASHDQWQVWDLAENQLLMVGKPETMDSAVSTFTIISWPGGDHVAAATVDKVFVWSIEAKERLFVVRSNSVVTSLVLDTRGVVIGDRQGDITVRDLTDATKLVLSLASEKESLAAASAHAANLEDFDDKVNALVRKSEEIVVAGSQSDGVSVWWSVGRGSLIKHWKVSEASVLSLNLDGDIVRAIVRHKSSSSSGASAAPATADSESPFELWTIKLGFAHRWVDEHGDASSSSGPTTAVEDPVKMPRMNRHNSDLRGGSKVERLLGAKQVRLPGDATAAATGSGATPGSAASTTDASDEFEPPTPESQAQASMRGRASKKLMQILGSGVLLKDESISDTASAGKGLGSKSSSKQPKVVMHKRINALRLAESDRTAAGGVVSRRRGSVHVKNTAYYPLYVPESVDGQFTLRNRTHLFPNSLFVTTYRNSGNIMISSAKEEAVSVENPHPIVAYTTVAPLIFSLHRDGVVQALNIDKVCVATSDINSNDDSSEGLSARGSSSERDLATLVLADPERYKLIIIKAYDDVYRIWEFGYFSSYDGSSLEIELRRSTTIDPSESAPNPLFHADSQDMADSSDEPSSPSFSTKKLNTIKPEEHLSRYWNDHLLLGSPQELQVFNLETLSLVQRSLVSDVSSVDADDSAISKPIFLAAHVANGVIVASTQPAGFVMISLTADSSVPVSMKTGSIISDFTNPIAEPPALLAGTADGFVGALRLSATAGSQGEFSPLRELVAHADPFIAACSMRDHPSAILSKLASAGSSPSSIAEGRLHKRISCMSRRGKWIAAGHEGDCISIWVYDVGMSQPVFVKDFETRGTVLDVAVQTTSMNALVRSGTGKDVTLEMLVINLVPLTEAADEAIKQNLAAVASAAAAAAAAATAAAVAAPPTSSAEATAAGASGVVATVSAAEFAEMKSMMTTLFDENRKMSGLLVKALEEKAQMAERLQSIEQQLKLLIELQQAKH